MKEKMFNIDIFDQLPKKRPKQDETYHALAMCIILQALKDSIGRMSGYVSGKDVLAAEAEAFLRSGYCKLMCVDMVVDGEKLLEHVREHGLPVVRTEEILGLYHHDRRKDDGKEGEALA